MQNENKKHCLLSVGFWILVPCSLVGGYWHSSKTLVTIHKTACCAVKIFAARTLHFNKCCCFSLLNIPVLLGLGLICSMYWNTAVSRTGVSYMQGTAEDWVKIILCAIFIADDDIVYCFFPPSVWSVWGLLYNVRHKYQDFKTVALYFL